MEFVTVAPVRQDLPNVNFAMVLGFAVLDLTNNVLFAFL